MTRRTRRFLLGCQALAAICVCGQASALTVTSLQLINADTDQVISTVSNGSVIDFAVVGTRKLNIVALTSPAIVGSVRFGYDAQSNYRTDSTAPYSLAGDSGGNYAAWTPSLGTHKVKATPYKGVKASGKKGPTVQVSFTVVDKPVPAVTAFQLMNADTGQLISTLTDAATINLAMTPTRNLNIVALTSSPAINNVQFSLDGDEAYSTDPAVPYALAGDFEGNLNSWTPAIGNHILDATPWYASGNGEAAGIPLAVQFQVIDQPQPSTFPGQNWATRTPAQVGLNAAKLGELKAFVGGRGMVVREGFQAYAWGDIKIRANFASAVKPIFTHLMMHAVQSGLLGGIDDRVAVFEPRLESLNGLLGFKDREITWRHLANMSSGYGVSEMPGTAFDYNDYAIALYVDTLINRVYGSSWTDADVRVLNPILANRIGWQDQATFAGVKPGRMSISIRDMARFGLLYLHRGEWNGSSVLASEWVDLALQSPAPVSLPRTAGFDAEMIGGQRSFGGGKDQSDHHGSYSFNWWTNGITPGGTRYWPALPPDAFAADGNWGRQVLLVVPSLDLVVSWQNTTVNSLSRQRQAFALLMQAIE